MFSNYFKVAWRNLMRYKGFSLLNIVSLTLGITFALLISLWVKDEMSYNRFHSKINNLYFVRTNINWEGLETSENTPGPLRERLVEEIPEIAGATRVSYNWDRLFSFEEKDIKASGFYTDVDFLSMFTFPTIYGNTQTALNTPGSIVITQDLAEQLFGKVDPVGKSVELDKDEIYTIKAVVEEVPNNSEIRFQWLAPWKDYEKEREWTKTWGNVSFQTYVELQEGASHEKVNPKIAYLGEAKEKSLEFFLQPLVDKYLHSKYTAGKLDGGRIEYVRLFSAIAIFLLIIACINFMNLATARAGRRAKEIGIRKVSGASRWALVTQFIGEVFILSSIALLLAIVASQVLLNWFNEILNKQITIDLMNAEFWGAALILLLVTSILAGSYPAFLLSALRPARVLKGAILKTGDQSTVLRKGLVILQFSISAFLIIGTLVIHQQISYVKNKNLGLDRNNLISMVMQGALESDPEVFRQELLKSSSIQSVSFSQGNPINSGGTSGDLQWPGKQDDETVLVHGLGINDGLLATLGIPIKEGRDFSKDIAADTSNYLVNETLVKKIGLENPVGTEVSFWNGKGQIIGVIADYHMQSLHQEIGPMVMTYDPLEPWLSWIKPAQGQTEAALAHLKEVSLSMNPSYPFEYQFADEEFERYYQNETLMGHLANVFGLVAILISCLGLLGLTAYAAERRRKEIGIRKVLGASIKNIISLLSKEFVYLILLSLLIALPIGWYCMRTWLENFAYHIDLQWWYFAITAIMALLIAALPVGIQGVKAALINPVESIRNE